MKKKISPLKTAIAILGLSTAFSLVGSISGTIAWYAYSTRALVSYTGTSVQSTTQLQIGIKSDIPINFTTNASLIDDVTFEEDLYYDEVNDPHHIHKLYHKHYYFMKVGSGGMPAAIINDYLSAKGYATNVLEPLSSYAYNTGEEINLRNRPVTNKGNELGDTFTEAEITKYVEIPFVFRVLASNSETLTYVANHDVFLSGATAIAATNVDENAPANVINNSIRLYIDRSNGENFIFNPTSSENGRDKVAGALNLTGGSAGHGYYDYDSVTLREYLYGDYEWKEGKNWDNSLSDPLDHDSELVDINGTGNDSVETTFTSRHHKDVKYFSDLDSCIIPHYANYLGSASVLATKNAQTGILESNYPVCRTGGESSHYLGLFNMKIYLEGWDHSVVDSQLQNKFYLGLQFEINIVR